MSVQKFVRARYTEREGPLFKSGGVCEGIDKDNLEHRSPPKKS